MTNDDEEAPCITAIEITQFGVFAEDLKQQYNVSTSTAAKLLHFIHLHQESRDNIKSMTKRWPCRDNRM